MGRIWLTSHLLLWLLVALEGIAILVLMRQVGALLLRVGSARPLDAGIGPSVGDLAPWLPEGWEDLEQESRLLMFMSPQCGTCEAVVPALNSLSRTFAEELWVAAIGRVSRSEFSDWARDKGLNTPAISSLEGWEAFGIDGTPYAFVLDGLGHVIGRGGVNHLEHLETLLRRCGLSAREELPVVRQPVLEG